MLIDSKLWDSGFVTVLPVVCASFILLFGKNDKGIHFFLANKVAIFLGLISYPLYLWHWPLLVFFKIVQDDLRLTINQVRLGRLIIIFISIFMAYLTFKAVEIPLSKSINGFVRKSGAKARVILFFCIGLLVFGGMGAFLAASGLPSRHLIAGTGDYKSLVFEVSEESLKNQLLKYRVCNRNYGFSKSNLDWCYQNGDSPEIALIGDSHARALFVGVAEALTNVDSILVARGACPPAIFSKVSGISTFDRCVLENRENFDYLLSHKNIKTVVMVTYGTTYSENSLFGNVVRAGVLVDAASSADDIERKREAFYEGMDEAINELLNAKKNVVLVVDVPEIGFDPVECVHARPYKRELRADCFVGRELVIDRQKNYRDIINKLKSKYKKIIVFDSLSVLCDDSKCYAGKDGHAFYHDDNHLGVYGSRLVGAMLVKRLSEL